MTQFSFVAFDGYEFRYADVQRKLSKMLGFRNIQLSKNIARDVTKESARAISKIAKDIIAKEVSDSGRLAASVGYYQPGYLRRKGTGSTAADTLWIETARRFVYQVDYGTNVSYAVPIFLGFSQTDTRVVYLPLEDRFITVKPFTFAGIHALERADAEFNADPATLQRIFERNALELVKSWNQAGAA